MKIDTLKQAIDYVTSIPSIENGIKQREGQAGKYGIFELAVRVSDYSQNKIKVFLNYKERQDDPSFKEDVVVEIQGTSLANFKLLTIEGKQVP